MVYYTLVLDFEPKVKLNLGKYVYSSLLALKDPFWVGLKKYDLYILSAGLSQTVNDYFCLRLSSEGS